jgi:hypothetical protein
MARKCPQAGDDRPFHWRQVVAETDRIDKFSRPLIVLGIERIDVAHPAAHEEENYGFGARFEVRSSEGAREFASLRPEPSQGNSGETARRPMQETAPGNASAREYTAPI